MEKKLITHLQHAAWERVKDQINALKGAYTIPLPGQIYAVYATDAETETTIYSILTNPAKP